MIPAAALQRQRIFVVQKAQALAAIIDDALQVFKLFHLPNHSQKLSILQKDGPLFRPESLGQNTGEFMICIHGSMGGFALPSWNSLQPPRYYYITGPRVQDAFGLLFLPRDSPIPTALESVARMIFRREAEQS
jgi:hypothetical protein